VYGVTTEEDLQGVGQGEYAEFKLQLTADKYGVPAAICDMLFAKYVAPAQALHTGARKRSLEEAAATYDDCVRGAVWTTVGHLPAGVPAIGALFNVTLMGEAGLGESAVEMHYCRKETVALWKFMDDVRNCGAHYGYLHGLPGTGKSTGVWHWLMSTAVHQHERVVWMHFSGKRFEVVVFHGGKHTSFRVRFERAGDFVETLPSCYLVADGLIAGFAADAVEGAIGVWTERGSERFAVMTTSGKFKLKTEEEMIKGYLVCSMLSWTPEDFQAACSVQSQSLWAAKEALFAGCDDPDDVQAAVAWKHHYAGGSARWMFAFSQPRVVDDVVKHIAGLGDATLMLDGDMGPTSLNMKTHLLASYVPGTYTIVSRYVADLLVKRAGAAFVKHMTAVAGEQKNPALRGWAFELGFFVEIKQAVRERRSVQVKVWGSGNNVESWRATPVSNFDPKEFKVPDILDAWARPITWNQGGYDAVLLTSVGDRKVAVRVVQVTAGITHSVKLSYVESLLERLVKQGFEVESVDVVFVVPRASAFRVGSISGPGKILQALGWRSGNELVRVVEL
jgi:hypothetical protein